jgi:hypothetical protein
MILLLLIGDGNDNLSVDNRDVAIRAGSGKNASREIPDSAGVCFLVYGDTFHTSTSPRTTPYLVRHRIHAALLLPLLVVEGQALDQARVVQAADD